MQPTIREVLASSALRGGRPEVLAGSDRLETPIRWVHVSEVRDVTGLIEGGELLLSTGLAMSGTSADAAAYVEDLARSGAAGLVVELGERFPAVPDLALARARALDLPLVVLHGRVRFVEVTEQVHRAIVADQLANVEFARQAHETFTRLSLEGADAATIVSTTAALCGSSVVLEDLGRHVLAFEARGRPAAGLLDRWEARSRAAAWSEAGGVTGPEGWFAVPVGRLGHRWARLVVTDPQAAQSRLAMALERAAQALELGRMVERDRLGLEIQAQGGLLGDLAAGVVDEETAAARATALGLPAGTAYAAVVALDPAPEPPSDPAPGTRELVERVSRALRTANLSGLAAPRRDGGVALLLSVPVAVARSRTADDPDRPDDTGVLESLAARLPGVVLGVGPVSPSVRTAGAGIAQAAHVADVAATFQADGRRPFYRASDIRLRGLVALLHDDPRVQAFVEAELGTLLSRDDELLDLLRDYVAVGGSMTRLAARTHRSRSAAYKKIARLERILGVSLTDPASLMSLGVAVLAHDAGHRDVRRQGRP